MHRPDPATETRGASPAALNPVIPTWPYLALLLCAPVLYEVGQTLASIPGAGSAAGVAVMGMEKIDFLWYAKRIGILALLGYFAGAACYLLVH